MEKYLDGHFRAKKHSSHPPSWERGLPTESDAEPNFFPISSTLLVVFNDLEDSPEYLYSILAEPLIEN
jgi:hypothetical protein